MFQLYKYRILSTLRKRTLMLWSLAFPIILGTFFHVAFGNLSGFDNTLSGINVAVVETSASERNETFITTLDEIAESDADYLNVKYVTLEEAESLLQKDDVEGIIDLDESINLVVKGQGYSQSILKSIVDQYLQMEKTITTVAEQNPQQLQSAIEAMSEEIDLNTETTLGSGSTDTMVQYFFALIAMACLYGANMGMNNVLDLQANQSPLGLRRCIAPTQKMKLVFSDFLAGVTLQFVNVLILLAYLIFILKIDFGNQVGWVLLTAFAGTVAGVALGSLLGTMGKASKNLKESLATTVPTMLCFLAGLMMGTMQDIIEHNAPIINRINPAALIKDAFYCLSVYDNLDRYFRNIISLIVIALLMCLANVLIMRREKYASV